MSHLSLVFASNSLGLSGISAANADRGFGGAEVRASHAPQSLIRDGEASRSLDYTLPAGVASMEHWLDLNA